ncbi:MAG: alpha/beta hydrolase [Candidatus Babeliales bacterium]
MKLNSVRSQLVVACSLIFFGLLVSLSISYYALYKLTFAGDRVFYGKHLSEVAAEIRQELLERQDAKSVEFCTQDGLKLSGFLITRKDATVNAVMCHGYQGRKEFMYALIDLFPDWNILLFDFRAHGQSEGTITSIGYHEYKDVIAAVNFMKKTFNADADTKNSTVVLGISMGGAATLKAAELEPNLADALIIDSTYAVLSDMMLKGFSVKSGLPYYPFFPLIKQMYRYLANFDINSMNPQESVKVIKKPIFFIHSCNDNFISPIDTLQLYANAKNKKSKLWIGPPCRHGWLHCYQKETYQRKVLKFVATVVTSRCSS